MDIFEYTIGTGTLPTEIGAGMSPKPNLRIRTPKEEDYDDYDDEYEDLEGGLRSEGGLRGDEVHEKDWVARKAAIAIANADASNSSPYFTVPVILLFLYVTFFKGD